MKANYLYRIMTEQEDGLVASFVKVFLYILSLFYGLIVRVNTLGYKLGFLAVKTLPVPVICVGNITWGGVGKTPLVMCLARALRDQGKSVAVLSRGYMPGSSSKNETISDEAVMMEDSIDGVSVLLGKNRFQVASKFLEDCSVDVFLMDDGFGHQQLKRDLNCVAIDARNPWGNGKLIPKGILREPKESLTRADLIVLTKTNLAPHSVEQIKKEVGLINKECPVVETAHKPVGLRDLFSGDCSEMSSLKGEAVVLLSSIGDPGSFEQLVEQRPERIVQHFKFQDHYDYQPKDIENVVQYCESKNVRTIITTQKDAVKIQNHKREAFRDLNILVLKIEIDFLKGKDVLFERITSVIHC